MYAEVVVGISIDKLDKTFCYRIPEGFGSPDTLIGTEVIVPFGKGNRETKAFVVEVKEDTEIDKSLIKDILRKSETGVQIEGKLIKLAYWLKSNYGGTVNEALRSVLQAPRKIERIKERTVSLLKDREEAEDILREFERKKYTVKAKILRRAIESDFNYERFIKEEKAASSAFNSLTKDGIIEIKEELLYRKPVKTGEKNSDKVELNAEQKGAVDKVVNDYRKGINGRYLLFGITGSGKTEVYMEIMEEVISRGKQVIFLIPEIALSFQMVERLSARFGERISIMNSRMSQGERYDQYLRAKYGDIDIIVGPRSALFTPFEHLGLIIVDEEHEGSYKSSKTPRYHAREVALYRAKEEGAAIILGSATPSLEAVKLASDKEIEVLMLLSRPAGAIPPEIEITDLREELKEGNKSIISRRLSELIKDRLNKGEQTILFINRRGYAGFISCRSCGEAIKCPHCDVSLTFHRPDRLVCHYCGYEEKMPDKCPKCASPYIGTFGLGTEKVEEIVKKDFPTARVLRMDGDTTTGKNGHEAILESFKNGEADILIGTQMIVKGHDFEKVSLVGILAADLSLFLGDFRAAETTYELLVQAAGRAGRGRYRGKVVIQTYNSDHYVIQAAATGNYKDFYSKEIRYRKLGEYPPETHLLAVILFSAKAEEVSRGAEILAGFLTEKKSESFVVNGPVWAAIPKLRDIYRKIIYLKSPDRDELVRLKNLVEDYVKKSSDFSKVSVQFDFEPHGNP